MSDKTFQAGLLGLSSASRQILTLFATIYLARTLSISDYGTFQQYVLIAGLCISILPLALPRVLLITLPCNQDRLRDVWASNQLSLIFLGLISFLSIVLFGDTLVKYFSNPVLVTALPIIAVIICVSIPELSFTSALIVNKRYFTILIYTIATRLTWIGGLILTSILFQGDLIPIFKTIAGISIITLIVSWIIMYNVNSTSKKLFDWNFIREDWSLGLPLGISSFVGLIAVRIDKILISVYYDPLYYAIFSVGAIEVPFIGYIAGAAFTVITPLIAQAHNVGNKLQILNLWHSVMVKCASLLLPIMGFLLINSRDLLVFVFSDSFESATPVFMLYLLLIPGKILSCSTILVACKETKFILKITIIVAFVNILAGITFIKIFGPLSVVIITLLAFYGGVIFGYLPWLRRYFNCKLQDLIPVKQLSWIVIATLFGCTVSGLIKFLVVQNNNIVFLLVNGLLYSVFVMYGIKKTIGIDWFKIIWLLPRKF